METDALGSEKEGGMKLLPTAQSRSDDEAPESPRKADVEGYRVTQRALAKVRKAGLPRPFQRMVDGEPLNPILDLNLADVDNGTLGSLLVRFTASCEYATYAAAIADIDRTVEQNVLEFVEAKVRLSKTGTVQRKADKTNVDPLVIDAKSRYLEKDAISTLTAAIQKNYERSLSTISREITRRQTELEHRGI